MKRYIILGLFVFIIQGCLRESSVNKSVLEQEIKNTDLEFSALSVKEGIASAFIEYAADDVVLLRDKSFPIIGIDSLKASFTSRSSQRRLEWKPWKVEVSKSGELGYTIGNWKLTHTDSAGNANVYYGNYFTVWKKINGQWKYVVDGGTETPVIEDF